MPEANFQASPGRDLCASPGLLRCNRPSPERGSRTPPVTSANAAAAWRRCCWAAVVAAVFAFALAAATLLLAADSGSSHQLMPLRLAAGVRLARAVPKQQRGTGVPPQQFQKWRLFATAKQCSVREEDYAQILSDLEPFRLAGGITEAAVHAAAALVHGATAILSIRDGRAADVREESGNGTTAKGGAKQRYRLPYGGFGWYRSLMAGFEADLPDMKLLFNFGDLPFSWAVPLPAADEAALADGTLSVQEAWERHGCDGSVMGAGMRRRHGLFQPGTAFTGRRGPLPILSGWRVEGCFSDILVPHAWSNRGNATRLTLSSGCPLNRDSWANKSDVAFWRGSSTGAQTKSTTPPEVWRGFHRQRLVDLSRAHPTSLDAAFTKFTQCDPPSCAAQEAHYGLAPFANASRVFSQKYIVVVDGNGAATRYGPTLCSGSLALDAQMFREWFSFRLRPFKHFVPVRPDYSDLLERVKWARTHDAEAQQIASNAVAYVNSQLREADIQCYLYRLLLEYGAIYRAGKPGSADAGQRGSGGRSEGSGSGGGGEGLEGRRGGGNATARAGPAAQQHPP